MKNALFVVLLTCFLCAEIPAMEIQKESGKQDAKEQKYNPVPPLFFVKQFSAEHYATTRAKEDETPDKDERHHREMLKVTTDTFQANDSAASAAKFAAVIALFAAFVAWGQFWMFDRQLGLMRDSNAAIGATIESAEKKAMPILLPKITSVNELLPEKIEPFHSHAARLRFVLETMGKPLRFS